MRQDLMDREDGGARRHEAPGMRGSGRVGFGLEQEPHGPWRMMFGTAGVERPRIGVGGVQRAVEVATNLRRLRQDLMNREDGGTR